MDEKQFKELTKILYDIKYLLHQIQGSTRYATSQRADMTRELKRPKEFVEEGETY